MAEWEREYGRTSEDVSLGVRFAYVLKQAHRKYGRRAVVLIDEYDKPILDVLDTKYTIEINGERRPIEDVNRDILKGFYSVFKAGQTHQNKLAQMIDFHTDLTTFRSLAVREKQISQMAHRFARACRLCRRRE